MIVKLILSTVVYPALSAALIWFLALWLGRGKTRAWPNAAALASAYMVAYLGLEGIPQFPPPASLPWLFFWIPVFALLGWLLSVRAWPIYVRMVLYALVSLPALYFTLRSTVQYEWQPGVTILWLTGLTGILLLSQATLNRASRIMDRPPAEWLFLGSLLFATGVLSLALGASGSVKLAQLGGALGTVVFVHTLFRFRQNCEPLCDGGILPLSLTYLGLVLNGVFYSELPRSSAGLLMLCLLSPGLLLLPPLRNRPISVRLAVLITSCLVCGGLAVGLAATAGSGPADYYDY